MSEQMVEGVGGKKGDSNGHFDEATECLGAEASAGGGKLVISNKSCSHKYFTTLSPGQLNSA